MAGMADRIVEARKAMKMVQEALAEKVGVTQRTVSRWEKGETIPARSDMERLAGALGVSLLWLLDGKKEVMECIRVPCLSPEAAAQCGGGAIVGDVLVEEEVWVPESEVGPINPDKQPFAIRASGDCMAPSGIIDGAYLVVNPALNDTMRDGEVVVAKLRFGELTTKHAYFKRDGSLELVADDPTYRAMLFSKEDVALGDCTILGPVVFILQKPKRRC